MIKEILIGLIVLAFVIPFTFMIVVDLIEIYKRVSEFFTEKVKPAIALSINAFLK